MADNSAASNLVGTDLSNLYAFIDKDNVHGLNLAVPEDAKDIIKPWDERESTDKYADSGVDDQMILHIPFTQQVRLKSILLKLGRGEATPQHLRVYANFPNIVDFNDAETTTPHVNITLLDGETGVIEYPFRVAAFTSVTSLSLFFVSLILLVNMAKIAQSESVGGELSRIFFLGFRGDTKSTNREGTSKLEIPAANAADAPLVDKVSERAGNAQTTAR
ncbi:galactose-binding domain-like protein [Roridomyces roridus]|uniref:Galactose-binding domain-like protein n=1 Tax=Roridomyces roridus TaxID=1738132 RepID=A0AAD7BZG1_9AGAR|nr:galactose-binding domain-like protein [Roridomyces roridus]